MRQGTGRLGGLVGSSRRFPRRPSSGPPDAVLRAAALGAAASAPGGPPPGLNGEPPTPTVPSAPPRPPVCRALHSCTRLRLHRPRVRRAPAVASPVAPARPPSIAG